MGRPIQIDIDCNDPESLATFWAEALDYRIADVPTGHATWADFSRVEAAEPDERWCRIVDASGSGPAVLFHRVPEAKTVKNRLHLDVFVARPGEPEENWPIVIAEVERLVTLGGAVVREVSEDDQCFVVMTDPEGNEFCVCG